MKKWDDMKPGENVSIIIDGKLIDVDHVISSKNGIKSSTHILVLDTDKAFITMEINAISK